MIFANNLSRHIYLDELSAVPKYLQISKSIISAVDAGRISKGAIMPSINDLSNELCVSRGTIEKGYKYLKTIKALSSYPGKGYYISDISFRKQKKVCLLFNKLSAQKKIIYDSFVSSLGDDAIVTLFIYNNDFKQFETLVNNNVGEYSHFVIVPHFIEHEEQAFKTINSISRSKVILLDKKPNEVTKYHGSVYENFEKDIYRVLNQIRDKVSKYEKLNLVFPDKSYYPKEIVKGFTLFCRQYGLLYSIIDQIETTGIDKGEAYITLSEDDLVSVLDILEQTDLKLGSDVGVISYNETPIKKYLLNGITTISTDFKLLGNYAAQLVLDDSEQNIEVPFNVILRNSL
jgi:DNA-binding transcriptional regulator YhcF (GntR family)